MKYGFCKEFSTPMKTEVDYDLIRMIKDAGFDFVEMRAMLVASLTDEEFEKLASLLEELELGCDCSCALFPRTIPVKKASFPKINNSNSSIHAPF